MEDKVLDYDAFENCFQSLAKCLNKQDVPDGI